MNAGVTSASMNARSIPTLALASFAYTQRSTWWPAERGYVGESCQPGTAVPDQDVGHAPARQQVVAAAAEDDLQ